MTKKLPPWAALAALAAAAPLVALAQPAPKKRAPSAAQQLALPEIKDWTLPNGLQVIYLGKHDAPVVTVQVFYHVGSKDEARDRRGSAHMFEHMMFKGNEHVHPELPGQHVDKMGDEAKPLTSGDVAG